MDAALTLPATLRHGLPAARSILQDVVFRGRSHPDSSPVAIGYSTERYQEERRRGLVATATVATAVALATAGAWA